MSKPVLRIRNCKSPKKTFHITVRKCSIVQRKNLGTKFYCDLIKEILWGDGGTHVIVGQHIKYTKGTKSKEDTDCSENSLPQSETKSELFLRTHREPRIERLLITEKNKVKRQQKRPEVYVHRSVTTTRLDELRLQDQGFKASATPQHIAKKHRGSLGTASLSKNVIPFIMGSPDW